MPDDGIVQIAIDIGTIREAQRRVAVRRLTSDQDAMAKFQKSLSKARTDIVDMIRGMNLEDETNAT